MGKTLDDLDAPSAPLEASDLLLVRVGSQDKAATAGQVADLLVPIIEPLIDTQLQQYRQEAHDYAEEAEGYADEAEENRDQTVTYLDAATAQAAVATTQAGNATTQAGIALAAADVAQSYTGIEIFLTKSAMDGDLAHDANIIARVVQDSTVGNNRDYIKVGASGTGSWSPLYAGALQPFQTRLDFNETGYITDLTIGLAAVNVGGAAMGNQTYLIDEPIPHTGYLRRLRFDCIASGSYVVKEYSVAGGTATWIQERTFTIGSSGPKSYAYPTTLDEMWVTAGNRFAVFSLAAGSRTTGLTSSPTPYYAISGNNTTSFSLGARVTTVRLEVGFDIAKRVLDISSLLGVKDRVDDLDGVIFVDQLIGVTTPVTTSNSVGNTTYYLDYPIKDYGRYQRIRFWARALGTVYFKLSTRSDSGANATFTFSSEFSFEVKTLGMNTLEFPATLANRDVAPDLYLGFHANGIIAFQAVADNRLTTRNYNVAGNNTTNFTSGTANTTTELQICVEFKVLQSVSDKIADDTVHLVVETDRVRCYMYCGVGYWAEFAINKATTVGTGLGGSFNGWRTEAIWKCVKSTNNRFYRVAPVSSRPSGAITSEMDMAVQVVGAADFVGGHVHGFEQYSSAAFILNGEVIDAGTPARYVGTRLEMWQVSQLFFQGTNVANPANLLADVVKILRFSDRRMRTEIRPTFAPASTDISLFYVGMLPISGNDTIYGAGVDRASRSPAWPVTDVTGVSNAILDTGAYDYRSMWGTSTKLRARVENLSGYTDPTRTAQITRNVSGATVNYKVYNSFLGGNGVKTVAANDSFVFVNELAINFGT